MSRHKNAAAVFDLVHDVEATSHIINLFSNMSDARATSQNAVSRAALIKGFKMLLAAKIGHV